jgi:Low molecular weight phosphotyrosine protein phosphatase
MLLLALPAQRKRGEFGALLEFLAKLVSTREPSPPDALRAVETRVSRSRSSPRRTLGRQAGAKRRIRACSTTCPRHAVGVRHPDHQSMARGSTGASPALRVRVPPRTAGPNAAKAECGRAAPTNPVYLSREHLPIRSPIAEGVLRTKLAEASVFGAIAVDSAGTSAPPAGRRADGRARATILRHGSTIRDIRTRALVEERLRRFRPDSRNGHR